MNVAATSNSTSEQVFLLQDYSTLTRYWKVRCQKDAVIEVTETRREPADFVHGMVDRRRLAGQEVTLGFLSMVRDKGVPNVPGYAKNLLVLANERLLGDGVAVPEIKFYPGFFKRDLAIRAKDGWSLQVSYRAPWIRELVRRVNFGKAPEYDPADFTERFVEAIRFHRPGWIVGSSSGR